MMKASKIEKEDYVHKKRERDLEENIEHPHNIKSETLTSLNPVSKNNEISLENIPQERPNFSSRSGGVYIPPFKLARMMEEMRQTNNHQSVEYQRLMWEMLRKSINGVINKVNITNIQNIIYEIFNE